MSSTRSANSMDQDGLMKAIFKNYVDSEFDDQKKSFLPEPLITELITRESIGATLDLNKSSEGTVEDSDLVDFIFNYAKKVFAIAIVIDFEEEKLRLVMRMFKNDSFGDELLPLNNDSLAKRACFTKKPWKIAKTSAFLTEQWRFLAPVFSKNKFKFNLEPDHILPFTWRSYDVKEGTFSQVFQVEIHKSHQEDPVLTVHGVPAKVAIKEIKDIFSSNEIHDANELQAKVNKGWEAEAEALHDISGLNHTNIIKRIAAITRGRKHYFMFQWADGGSLRDFWEENPRPVLSSSFVKEIILQFRGLAEALNELHNYNGSESYRHGDLKPENILIFKDNTQVGVFKIADMGLAKHHAEATYLRPPTSTRYGTVRYEPPETVTARLSAEGRSRLYDIWSMGCIALELMVWLLYGYEALLKFNESIKGSVPDTCPYFVTNTQNGVQVAEIHPLVRACIDHISKDPECKENTAISDLLEIVRSKLLVVRLPVDRPSAIDTGKGRGSIEITNTDGVQSFPGSSSSRCKASALCRAFDEMLLKAQNNHRYWYTGTKREDRKGPATVLPLIAQGGLLSPESANQPRALVDRRKVLSPPGFVAEKVPSAAPNTVRILSHHQLDFSNQVSWAEITKSKDYVRKTSKALNNQLTAVDSH